MAYPPRYAIHTQYAASHRGGRTSKLEIFMKYIRIFTVLTVNSIWGGTTPPNRKKIVKKNGKCNQDDFLLVLLKFSWTTFKTIFETLLALGEPVT